MNRLRQVAAFVVLTLGSVVMLIVAWRTAAGLESLRASGETTTILGIPAWWTYAAMLPGIALTSLVAFRDAVRLHASSRR